MSKNIDQRQLWVNQHLVRSDESRKLKNTPNPFAKECLEYLPQNGSVLEIGIANGRDARYFAKEKNIRVVGIDFSSNALQQLRQASNEDGTSELVLPAVADAKNLPLKASGGTLDAVYARSALHLSDEEMDEFLTTVKAILKNGGYLMIQGKPDDNYKMKTSTEVRPNLYVDNDGHARRLWNEKNINELVSKAGFQMVTPPKRTTEKWHDKDNNFISFIAQKK